MTQTLHVRARPGCDFRTSRLGGDLLCATPPRGEPGPSRGPVSPRLWKVTWSRAELQDGRRCWISPTMHSNVAPARADTDGLEGIYWIGHSPVSCDVLLSLRSHRRPALFDQVPAILDLLCVVHSLPAILSASKPKLCSRLHGVGHTNSLVIPIET